SMAASTACSASSEYGGRRSLYGSRPCGAIENSTGELDIFPGWAFPRWIAQQRGGVIRDDQRNAVILVHRAAQFTDRQLRLQQRLRGERAERDDDLRTNALQLAHEVRTARFDLLRHRVAVPRRSMLEHVADEYVFSPQVN